MSQLLDSKAPADSVRFKTWLHHIAENAAEASAEGVFMGFGGTQVSDAEKATLAARAGFPNLWLRTAVPEIRSFLRTCADPAGERRV